MDNYSSNSKKLLGILAAKLWLKNKIETEKNGLSDETYLEVKDLIRRLKGQKHFDSILLSCLELIRSRGEEVQNEKTLSGLIEKVLLK